MSLFDAPADLEIVRQFASQCRLTAISRCNPPSLSNPRAPTVLSVVRNELPRLSDFLYHYRRLGIERFAFIDNGSNDGTVEFLKDQFDCVLYATSNGFDWRRKHGWITHLITKLGSDRWYLLADADEHCVFDGSDRLPFATLISELENQDRTRARGALIDMYSKGPLFGSSRPPDMTLGDYFDYFDAHSYSEHRNAQLTSRTGGPRARAFGHIDANFRPQLTKYPLFKLQPGDVPYNPHVMWPPAADAHDPCFIGILHYKFDSDLSTRINEAVERKQYWNNSAEYSVYLRSLQDDPTLSFFWYGSRRYRSPKDLVAHGVIDSIPAFAEASREAEAIADAVRRAARLQRAEQLRRIFLSRRAD